ncbi:MAG: DNA helicase RecQ [Ignavibacteriae bacterium]|nr:DNA helicase RecQ [Ignavibacteriota bacterium]MCB9217569.1 DNA helicase RecQ [Ignavibacteria bacterium]
MNNLRATLQHYFGYSEFRPLQEEIISGVVAGDNSFVLMPTGGGKSLCYQLPALLLPGLTVVVSPLIALMKDQVDALQAAGVPATFINSSLDYSEIEQRKSDALQGKIKLLYLAPERLLLPATLDLLDRATLSLIAVDEAHCISEWGHDFRVDYRNLSTLRDRYPNVPVIAMTATANQRVRADILEQLRLGNNAKTYVASFDRPNLNISVQHKSGVSQIFDLVNRFPGESGIIYCMSRAATEKLAERLERQGYRALPYHAGLNRESRTKHQEMFERDEVDVICATIAFGMGIDKSNVRYVIHYNLPKNMMSYYQEIGRAGRDGLPSDCLLLYSSGDRSKVLHFITEMVDPQERAVALSSLDEITAYAESGKCRRKVLLSHFGEDYPEENCGACDNCLNPSLSEFFDATTMAQKLLSCVVRLKESFGISYTIDVLRGSEATKIIGNRHHLLPTWGVGKDQPTTEWRWLATALVSEGYLRQRIEAFNTLSVTEKGWEVLRNERSVELQRTRRPEKKGNQKAKGKEVLSETEQILFGQLRSLRKRTADRQNVPPYVIFGDKTLQEMAQRMPLNHDDLLQISGVGDVKANRYGRAFLELVGRFVEENPGVKGTQITTPSPRITVEVGELSESAEITGELFNRGLSPEEIAAERDITLRTIEDHISDAVLHGLIQDIDRIVPNEKARQIQGAFLKHGLEYLRPVMDTIGEENVTWLELKVVRGRMLRLR